MKRRQFLIAGISSIAGPSLAQNQIKQIEGSIAEPFRQIAPPVPGELRKVHAIIAFNCPVCSKYHRTITSWGRSLPKQFVFDFLPVITDKDSAVMATAWLALQKVAPDKLPIMAASFFSSIQDKGITPSSPGLAMLKKLQSDIGPTPGFADAMRLIQTSDLGRVQQQISDFKIDATPSIVVGGRYVITPDNVSGNDELFIQLASGLVSKLM